MPSDTKKVLVIGSAGSGGSDEWREGLTEQASTCPFAGMLGREAVDPGGEQLCAHLPFSVALYPHNIGRVIYPWRIEWYTWRIEPVMQ